MTSLQTNPSALRVLLAHGNPASLRALSTFLQSAGYVVDQVATAERALAAIEGNCPHFLIVDWNLPAMGGIELCGQMRDLRLPQYVFTFLSTTGANSHDLLAALQAGADDFLTVPIVHGELLARLRAGARVLEHERRLNEQSPVDNQTGLATRRPFAIQVSRKLGVAERLDDPLSIAVADIDLFTGIVRAHGQRAGVEALDAVVRVLVEQLLEGDELCRLDRDRFGILLSHAVGGDAAAWAERCRQAIAELRLSFANRSPAVTVSFGVAQRSEGTDAERLLELATEALQVAKESGRDRVIRNGTHDMELEACNPSQVAGDALNRTVARDVMTPCAVLFDTHEPLKHAFECMRQCRLSMAPVVNETGKCVGLLSAKSLDNLSAKKEWLARPVRDAMVSNVVCYDEETTLKTLYDLFRRDAVQQIVIVHGGRPTGIVTRGHLAVLSEPISEETFRGEALGTGSTLDLAVPDLPGVIDL